MEKINKIHKHKVELNIGMAKEHKEKIADFLNELNDLLFLQGSFVEHIDDFLEKQLKEENEPNLNNIEILHIKRQRRREQKYLTKLQLFLEESLKFYREYEKITIDHDCSIHPEVACPLKK